MKKNISQLIKISLISVPFLFTSCGSFYKKEASVQSYGWDQINVAGKSDDVLLRVAFLGDQEPKPCALFPHTEAAVNHINTLDKTKPIDFVIGVGDVAHKGTEIQYETATEVFEKLTLPLFPIMGNEEHGNSVENYLEFAKQWNNQIKSPNYILNHPNVSFVLASPDYSRDFDDKGIRQLSKQIKKLAPKPVILIVHSAQKGIYKEAADKGIGNPLFTTEIITQPNVVSLISGDLHLDLDRSNHSKKIGNIHYLHIPALERTKVPDESVHKPMVRVLTISKDGNALMETYNVGDYTPIKKHEYRFKINLI